jgi:hypothetical protein
MISDESCDTRPPANLSDADLLSGEFPPEGRPLSQPTLVTQAVLRQASLSLFAVEKTLTLRRFISLQAFTRDHSGSDQLEK